ncbi:MAG: ketoacyl-ACP synthase III [Thermoleophilia bacterium]|nr:ketoacyl-ACP synthase III [Thermoleophilia bacterium]
MSALGAYVPDRVVTNADFVARMDTTDEWIFSRTGIRERRYAAEDEATSDLAVRAAQAILDDAGVAAADLDAVIVPTCTPDYLFPSVAALTADRIGARRAAAFDLQAACSGFVYTLAQAASMIESGWADNVLVVGAEKFSNLVNPDDRSTSILFGDGAAGALVTAGDPGSTNGFLGFDLGADGSLGCELLIPVGGTRHPAAKAFEPQDAYLQMNGREVFKFATRAMEETTSRLLDALDMSIGDVDLLVAHQANQRIIDHAVGRLGVDPSKVFNNVEKYGNTSAASIPLALTEARDQGVLAPGMRVLLVGFGAGLTWASTIVSYEP